MKLILIFMSITKKIQVDNNDQEYILFRIDIYFTEYFLAVEIDEKVILTETLFLKKKFVRIYYNLFIIIIIRINIY